MRLPPFSLAFLLLANLAPGAQLPVEVTAWNAAPTVESATVNLPSGGNAAAALYVRMHNLRFGGQVSVRVNGGPWVHLYNHTVSLAPLEKSQGGIGGINRTIAFSVPLAAGQVPAGLPSTVNFRLNGTDGVVSAIRVIDLDILDSTGVRLLPAGEITQEDPTAWAVPPGSDPAVIAGANLWANATLKLDPIQNAPLNAKCASCHFADGSDLKYFNFSNKTIVARARFHGLSEVEGDQIASYIRSSGKPNPGRPWNPPFQPGPGLDPDPGDSPATQQMKAQSWMAGAGLDWIVADDVAALAHVFPQGTSRAAIAKVIEHEGTFSVREIPIPFQFADWNAWLPERAPEDMWPTSFYYDQPYAFYHTLRDTLATQGAANLANAGNLTRTFSRFQGSLQDWYGPYTGAGGEILDGGFRLQENKLSNDSIVSQARNPGLTREDVIRSLVHWMGVKVMEIARDFNIETIADAVPAMQAAGNPKYQPELLAIPGTDAVFSFAPHIISNNFSNFTEQTVNIAKMESDQWYHLALLMNAGARTVVNPNVPLDWDYQLLHLEEASDRTGRPYGVQHLITHLKMYQSRDNGAGIKQMGFTQRTLSPWRLYSDQYRSRSLHAGVFEAMEPGLWRKLFEEFMYEWFDVMESFDLNDSNLVPRTADRHELNPKTYVPVPWAGGNEQFFKHPDEVYADLMYRLLPLLPKEGVDPMLLQDLIRWSQRAWPGPSASPTNWAGLVINPAIYFENFEDGQSDFNATNNTLIVTPIKNNNYVNNYAIGIKNGGGANVGRRSLPSNSLQSGVNDTINVPVSGLTRLKIVARVAFKDNDGLNPGSVNFKIQVRFDDSATTYTAEDVLPLDPGLFSGEFETYESYVNVPADSTNLTWLSVSWERLGGAGAGTVYLDNLHILPVNQAPDGTAPGKPSTPGITAPFGNSLRVEWSANPAEQGVVGYNIYRWRSADSVSTKTKLNIGLLDNPYIRFADWNVPRGVAHSYHVTAVDAAGNESVPSNLKSSTLADTDSPLKPTPLWAVNSRGALRVGWFGSRDWDIAGYDVFRKANGEPSFTMLTTVADPAEAIYFADPTALDGTIYRYYVRAFDLVGNTSPNSPTVVVQSQTGITLVSLWKNQFQGVNGWDVGNPLTADDAFDFESDGVANLWEYVQGRNPALADSSATSYPTPALVSVGVTKYLEVSYERHATLPPGVRISVQFSNELRTWPAQAIVEGGAVGAGISVNFSAPAAGRVTVTVRQNAALGAGAFQFMRLSVEQTAP